MVVKKKAKKEVKKAKAKVTIVNKTRESEESNEEGMSLDDAFGDDEDVEYAPSKPAKVKKKKVDEEELEEELDEIESTGKSVEQGEYEIKASKPVSKIKKGDRIVVDGNSYIVDAHYIMIDHGTTKEMAIELYNDKDQDFQLRYFDDQVESTMEFYQLQEILYLKKAFSKVEW